MHGPHLPIYLSPETMQAGLLDIGRAVASTGAERLVLLNAHGGTRPTWERRCEN